MCNSTPSAVITQTSLFDLPLNFDGATIEPIDIARLTGQWHRVWSIMSDGKWRTLAQIQSVSMALFTKLDSEAAISARLRDFRKPRYGSHTVERRRVGEGGLNEYRLVI